MCYAVTPLLQSFTNYLNGKKEYVFWGGLLLLILGLQILDTVKAINITVPWLACYIVGYGISYRYYNKNVNSSDKLTLKSIAFILLPICIALNGFQIYIQYISKIHILNGVLKSLLNLIFEYAHACLGIILFLFFILIFNKIFKSVYKNNGFKNVLNYSDQYSFDIYIVHQIFILGKFSIMGRTPYFCSDILIIIILVLISSFVLRKMSSWIHKLLIKKVGGYF